MARRRSLLVLLLALAAVLTGLAAPAQASRPAPRPIVFLHGFSGSGGQFETPARRFASNGYPARRIEAQEYDSTFATVTQDALFAQLDARITRLLTETRADRVDLVAHSLGTFLSQRYLTSSPERAARVAHYVNLDGAPAAAPPGGVPTLAIWGEGDPARAIAGGTNVYLPGQSHTQTVTSAESFAAQYRFLTGREPRTTAIVPQRLVLLSGRAVLFPANAGVSGATLDVWRVHDRTGERAGRRPVASFTLTGDGSFGPFLARGAARYEFAIRRADGGTHHLYFEPFRRSDRLIRLLTSEPGTGVGALVETSDRHTALTVSRNKEWWGDQGTAGDTLRVNGTDALPGVALRARRAIGVFAFDAGSDGVSRPGAVLPQFAALPFLTGVDLFVPSPGRVRLESGQRGTGLEPGREHRLTVPAWPSSTDRVSVQFDDWSGVSRRGR